MGQPVMIWVRKIHVIMAGGPAMKIASNSTCDKPTTEALAVESQRLLEASAAELLSLIVASASQGRSFDEVERKVHQSVLEMGQQAMNLFVGLQGDGDLGESVTGSDGRELYRSENTVSTKVRSIFGCHCFWQFAYSKGSHEKIELLPISARMSLPELQWSYLLQEFSQMLAVDSSYEQAVKTLGRILCSKYSVDTAQQVNHAMGAAAQSFIENLPSPLPDSEASILVASADCKGVPLVKEDAQKVAAFESQKKRPGNRRMAAVTSVYSVQPHHRTAEDITMAMFREEPFEETTRPPRPKPKNKNTTAHMPQLADEGDGTQLLLTAICVGIAWLATQIQSRRRADQELVVLMDGQESLWSELECYIGQAEMIPILDIIHVLSYLWEAAGLFEKNEQARKAFTRERCLRVLKGDVQAVIKGLRRMGTTAGLSGNPKRDLARICTYLENNAGRMRYDEYLAKGYPIATGVIEGACRHLVKDRMERSGMRWTLQGASDMLNVRALHQSDHWQAFLEKRIQTATETIHKNRQLINDYQPVVLAC
jgi:hypothetical protein